jgi:hypothetical protein
MAEVVVTTKGASFGADVSLGLNLAGRWGKKCRSWKKWAEVPQGDVGRSC